MPHANPLDLDSKCIRSKLSGDRGLVTWILRFACLCSVGFGSLSAALVEEKEISLVTGEAIGELAVSGRLLVDLHADFMLSRTLDQDTVLNWYNCGLSGGGKVTEVGGDFGDFGLHCAHDERDAMISRSSGSRQVPTPRSIYN